LSLLRKRIGRTNAEEESDHTSLYFRTGEQDVIAGKLDPSPVLDMTVDLDGVPSGYAAMDNREAIKVMVRL